MAPTEPFAPVSRSPANPMWQQHNWTWTMRRQSDSDSLRKIIRLVSGCGCAGSGLPSEQSGSALARESMGICSCAREQWAVSPFALLYTSGRAYYLPVQMFATQFPQFEWKTNFELENPLKRKCSSASANVSLRGLLRTTNCNKTTTASSAPTARDVHDSCQTLG